jgi:uncharacterized protein
MGARRTEAIMRIRTRKQHGKPDPAIVADVVKRIVRVAKPKKIVLFGSAARGTMGPNSDYDFLVIKGGKFNHWRVVGAVQDALRDKDAAVDIVLVTPDDVERYRDAHCLVICPALREGRVVYESKSPSAKRSARMVESRPRQSRPSNGARTRRIPWATIYLAHHIVNLTGGRI